MRSSVMNHAGVSAAAVALIGLVLAVGCMPAVAQDAEPVAVIDEDFSEDIGAFRTSRVSDEDIELADGVLSVIGQADGNVRALDANFGVPLPGSLTIAARMRADEGAYGGLYIYGGGRNTIQLGLGQGSGREGLMVELDNYSTQLRQVFYPDIGTKQEWRDYLVEVEGDQVVVTVDGEEVVNTTYSGRTLDRIAIWNGMNSRGAVQTDSIRIDWQPERTTPPVASLRDDFDTAASLDGWYAPDNTPEFTVDEDEGAEDGQVLFMDFRDQGRWMMMHETPIALEPRTQYELKMRLRGVSGVMGVRLAMHQLGTARPLARIESRATRGYIERTATFVTGAEPGMGHMMLQGVWGGGTVWVDRVEIAPADVPIDPYETGVNVLHTTLHEPGSRVGLMIEAEDAAPETRISDEDTDGDGRWASIEIQMPEQVISDVAVNPWGFSNNTIVKSDTEPDGEPLALSFEDVIPGRYRAYLSDPKRDMALREDGEWVRVAGGREYDLGVVEVDEDFEIVVSHMYTDEVNPGPVYLDYVRFLPLPDEEQIAAEAGAVHEALQSARDASWDRSEASFAPVTLTVSERAGVTRANEPVVTGVPLAEGTLHAGARLRLEDAEGQSIAFDAEPLVHWPDGSVKWLRLRFHTDLPAGEEARVVLRPDQNGEPLSRSLEVEELGTETAVETSALRVSLGGGLIEQVETLGEDGPRTVLTGPVTARLAIGDRGAEEASVAITEYRLVERSPHGTMVSFEGELQWDGPNIGVRGRLLVEEQRPAMMLEAWLVQKDDSWRLELHEAELALGVTPAASQMTVGLKDGTFERELGDGWSALQDGEGYDVASFEGTAAVGPVDGEDPDWVGERLGGWMALSGEHGTVAVGVREMAARHPKSLTATPEAGGARITFGIWPAAVDRSFTWAQSSAIAHHIALGFADGEADADEVQSLVAGTMHPLHAIATAEHYCDSGAFGPIQPRSEPAAWPNYEAEVDRAFDLIVNNRSAYGMEDFGGVFQPGGYVPGMGRMWTNMEYDFPHATLSQFARTARADMLERADQATRHFVPVDIIHWSRSEHRIGGSFVHSHTTREGHQLEGPNFGHAGWPQGPLQVYYLTGERQGLDAGLLLSRYVAYNSGPRPEDTGGRPPYGLREERDAGNAILTSIVTYEVTNDPELLEVVYRVLDFVERCQSPGRGNWDTPNTEDPPHRGTTFMLHQLIKGLDAMYEVTREPRVEEIFRRFSTWLLTEAADETYRYAHKYAPKSWRGRSVRNFPNYALGFERAAQFSEPDVAEALREQAFASMEALFGARDAELRNVLFETDTANSEAHTAARVRGGALGEFHDYALTVREDEYVFEVDGTVAHEGSFSGQPARWLRLWSGIQSVGPIEIDSFTLERLGDGDQATTIREFTFDDPDELAQWSGRVPEDTESRIEVTDGKLVLVDTDRALIGAELDLPEDLGPDYRIRWRQAMSEERYGGLMVFGPGDFEFDLYNHQPVAILHVGINQGEGAPYRGLFDNPRSFAPKVTYLNQLISWLASE
ncbi:MAG: hypothetical protein ACQER1_09905 [Armatimonadota bacterium]